MSLPDRYRTAALVLPSGDPDGTGAREFRFEVQAGADGETLEYGEELDVEETSGGQRVQTVLSNLLGEQDESVYQRLSANLGAGLHTITINGETAAAAQAPDGTLLQWGDDTDNTLSSTSATGQHPIAKVQVGMDVLTKVQLDSLPKNGLTGSDGLGEIHFAERHPNGVLDPISVVPLNIQLTSNRATTASVTITTVSAKSLEDVIDSVNRQKGGAQ